MFGLGMLDVAIGLALVFFVFSLALTAANEALDAWLKLRASNLERGLRELLDDEDGTRFAKAFFDHPLIYPLYRGAYDPASRTLPSYIPARNFSLALLDLVAGAAGPEAAKAPSDKIRKIVSLAIKTGGGDPDRTRAELEAWYDSAMDRVSGWYKRRTQMVTFGLALGLAIIGNVNAIAIFQSLQGDANLRAALVKQVEELDAAEVRKAVSPAPAAAAAPAPPAPPDNATAAKPEDPLRIKLMKRLQDTTLPIGWSGSGRTDIEARWSRPGLGAIEILIGWLLTAFALALGAPFWFDILNRLMVIRSTVKPHEKSGEEASEERTDPKRPSNARTDAVVATLLAQTAAARSAPAFAPSTAASDDVPPAEDDQDGCICDHEISEADATRDEDLPPAAGGVAAPYAPPVPA